MCATVEDMLTLARADEGQLVLVREPLDLREVAADVRESLANMADLPTSRYVSRVGRAGPRRSAADRASAAEPACECDPIRRTRRTCRRVYVEGKQ